METLPLCRQFPSEGSVSYTNYNDKYEGYFSFVLYRHFEYDINYFKTSHYYIGLYIYSQILLRHPFFNKYGMIIYTDEATLPTLSHYFSSNPKVMLAVTSWPQFTYENKIEGSILRCMRFHALEAFPTAHILSRDADTIFPSVIQALYNNIKILLFESNDIQLVETALEKKRTEARTLAFAAEGKALKNGKSRAIANNIWNEIYDKEIKVFKEEYDKLDEKYTDETIIETGRILSQIIGNWEQQFVEYWFAEGSPILIGTNFKYSQISWHAELPLKYSMKTNIPSKECEYISRNLFEKYTLEPPLGVYAGFVNFNKERPRDLWIYSYDYLQTHYSLDKKIISNKYSFINSIGKDERVLIYCMIAKYWSLCYFLQIHYQINNKNDFNDAQNILNAGVSVRNINITNTNPIRTIMLQESYIPAVFKLIYNYKTLDPFIAKWVKGFEIVKGVPVSLLTKDAFKNYSQYYLKWSSEFMSKSDEELQSIIKSISSCSINGPIKRIEPSRLPPISFKEYRSINNLAKEGGLRKTRRRKRSQR
jgi:hypothetical protein